MCLCAECAARGNDAVKYFRLARCENVLGNVDIYFSDRIASTLDDIKF